jgi:hypothetical protein
MLAVSWATMLFDVLPCVCSLYCLHLVPCFSILRSLFLGDQHLWFLIRGRCRTSPLVDLVNGTEIGGSIGHTGVKWSVGIQTFSDAKLTPADCSSSDKLAHSFHYQTQLLSFSSLPCEKSHDSWSLTFVHIGHDFCACYIIEFRCGGDV